MADAMQSVRRSLKMADRIADGYIPPLGGERYLTDRELIQRLHVSRRPCSSTVMKGYCHISCLGARHSTVRVTSRKYWNVTTVRLTDACGDLMTESGDGQFHTGCRLPTNVFVSHVWGIQQHVPP